MRNNLVRSVLASSFFATPRRRWRLFAPRHKMSKVMVALAFIVSAIFLTSTAQAQTYKAMPLDGGGWTSGFAQANNGRLYAYGDVFGAWRSDDGGNNWTYLNWDIKPKEVEPKIPGGDVVGMGMAVQKDNADVVYYASFNAFYKSIDGGTTWARYLDDIAWGDQPKEFRRFRGTSQILIRPNNPNEIWFAGPRKNQTGWLWKSINGGVNWVKAGGSNFDSNKARTLHNVATFANQIWVGSDNGLYVSTDGGNNFNLVGNSTSLKDVGMISRFTSGTFAGVGLVTRANNNGGGISRITATNYNDANTYTVSDAATNNLYFGYPTGLQIFSDGSSSAWNTSGDRHGFSPAGDGGQTFTVRATTLNTNPTPIWTTAAIMAGKNHPDFGTDQVIEDVNNPNKWIITGGGAAMYSLDKGFSWQYFPNGVGIAAVKTYLASVSRFDANRVYVPASDIGSVIVTDGGASGQASLSSCKFFTTLHGSHRVMEGPNTQNLVVAGVNQGACASILLKSSDGGTTWNNFNLSGSGLPLSYDGICKTAMSINDSNDFLISLASAATADNQSSVPPNSINPGVWRTTNGGTSFAPVTGLPAFNTLDIGIRYGPQNSYIERDATQADLRYFVSRHIGNNPSASTQFYRSTNGGSNWTPSGYIFGTGGWVWALCADPIRTNTLWAAGGGFGVKVSRDGGVSWNPTAQFFDAKYVSSCDGKIAVWGRKDGEPNPELLWYSADDGATWTVQSTVEKNFHSIQGITVDRNGKIWVSWNSVTVVTPVGAALTAPAIATQPANQSSVVGASANFSVSISGNPAPSIQWQRAANGSSTFTNLANGGSYSGVTTSTLTVSSITAGMSGDRFRAVGNNSQGNITSAAGTLTVTASPVPVINSALTRSGNVGTSLSYTITASNSPTSYNATGLPAGLNVNTSTGVISGTPSASGTTNTSITATNAGGTSTAATLVFTINAALPPITVITSSLNASATAGTAFSYSIIASNSPTSYGASNLPAGLSVNTSTGVISGTPSAAGTSNVSISATNGGGTDTETLVITIAPDPNAPVKLTGTVIGTSGSYNNNGNTRDKAFDNNTTTFFDAAGANGNWVGLDLGTAQVINQVRYFPRSGLGSRMNGGIFQGSSTADFSSGVTNLHTITSNAPDAFTTVAISNGTGFRYVRYLSPNDGYGNVAEVEFYRSPSGGGTPVPVITSTLTRSATVGTAFSYSIIASNSPTSYNATSLPAGLSVNTSTGVISGTPTATGTSNVSISATNGGGTDTEILVITTGASVPATPVITSSLSASATVGTAFSYSIIATNSPTSYNATSLPAGLSVNTSTGVISGTPSAAGTSNVSISATNAGGPGSNTLVITVNAASGGNFPIITSRGENLPNEGNAEAFDLDNNSKWLDFSATSFLQIQYQNAVSFNQYSIVSGNDASERDPVAWTIQGSNNGTNWTTLDTRTNQSWASRNLARSFSFTNSTAYSYYKMNITAIGSGAIVQLSELTYSTSVATPVPVITSTLTRSATVGTAFSYTITASNSPTSYNATGLPAGLSVNTSTGVISGTPSAAGTSNVSISATNAGGPGSNTLVITVGTNGGGSGTLFTGTVTGSAAYNNDAQYAASNVFDGNINTFFAPTATNSFAQLDLGTTVTGRVSSLRFYPRVGFSGRMLNGVFQASTNGTSWVTLHSVTSIPSENWNTIAVSNANFYRYFRYYQAGDFADVSEVEFLGTTQSGVSTSNNVTLETWTNITGTSVSNIPVTTAPNTTATLTSLETTSNSADNYGVRIRGYIVPSTTGNYTFYIASDDNGEFYLSTDNQPINSSALTCSVPDWTNSREWNKFPSQTSSVRNLVAGQKYYFRALMKEGAGGDNLAIGWTGPGISTITVIGAANLDRYIPSGAPGEMSVSDAVVLSASAAKGVAIYPNPASTSFNVSSDDANAKISITSLDGRLMKSVTAKEKLTTIDSSNWTAGVYIINVESNNQATIKKIVIAK